MDKQHFVYILANRRRGALYVGVTSNLTRRTQEHKDHAVAGFTTRYDIRLLVHFEEYPDPETAIRREKQLKGWRRQWKLELTEKGNPQWLDLSRTIAG